VNPRRWIQLGCSSDLGFTCEVWKSRGGGIPLAVYHSDDAAERNSSKKMSRLKTTSFVLGNIAEWRGLSLDCQVARVKNRQYLKITYRSQKRSGTVPTSWQTGSSVREVCQSARVISMLYRFFCLEAFGFPFIVIKKLRNTDFESWHPGNSSVS